MSNTYRNEKSFESSNNDLLIDQIRLCIVSDHNSGNYKKFPNGQGEIEFEVRNGQLQKNVISHRENLMADGEAKTVPVSRKHLEVILRKITDRITTWDPINYAKIKLEICLEDEVNLRDLQIGIRFESHFKRQ